MMNRKKVAFLFIILMFNISGKNEIDSDLHLFIFVVSFNLSRYI